MKNINLNKIAVIGFAVASLVSSASLSANDTANKVTQSETEASNNQAGATVEQHESAEDTDKNSETAVVDIIAGEKLYKKTCKNCHGPTAKGMASFPKLADKETDYLISRLEQYRAGEQVGPNTPLMSPQAAKLSDEDIANIAGFIATLGK